MVRAIPYLRLSSKAASVLAPGSLHLEHNNLTSTDVQGTRDKGPGTRNEGWLVGCGDGDNVIAMNLYPIPARTEGERQACDSQSCQKSMLKSSRMCSPSRILAVAASRNDLHAHRAVGPDDQFQSYHTGIGCTWCARPKQWFMTPSSSQTSHRARRWILHLHCSNTTTQACREPRSVRGTERCGPSRDV